MDSSEMKTDNFVQVGIDFGGDSCRVSVVDKFDKITLHVNRVSNRQTPTLISFDKRLRIYGEEAEARSSTLFKNSIPLLPYVVGLDKHELVQFVKRRKYLFFVEVDESTGSFKVTFDDSPLNVYPVEAFSFFVNKVLETVRNEFKLDSETGNEKIHLALSVPSYFTEKFKSSLYKSLSLSGFKNVKLFKETDCILKRWSDSQLPESYDEFCKYVNGDKEQQEMVPMKVAFLDVGLVHTTFFVAEFKHEDSGLTGKVVSESSSDQVGAYYVVESLCDHVRELVENVYNVKTKVPSRQSYYLYKSCVKCVKELSVLNEAKLDVERVLEDDEDYTTNFSRSKLEELAKPVKERLCKLMDEVLSKTDRGNYLSIEMLGGGSRMPFVKEVANHYAEQLKCMKKTRTSLDTTSAVSYGATQLLRQYDESKRLEELKLKEDNNKEEENGDNNKEENKEDMVLDNDSEKDNEENEMKVDNTKDEKENKEKEDEEMKEYLEKENKIRAVENEYTLKMTTLNEIDNYVIKAMADLSESYRDLVDEKNMEKIDQLLNDLQMFSSEAMNDKDVDSKMCFETLKKTQERLKELAPKYVEELEEEMKRRLKEQNESNEHFSRKYAGKEVDMDVVLPNKTCIKRAQKNKEEGNELVAAGNVELAVQHYVKVIQYCAKVSNPNEEEKSVVNDLRLASNLNLAMMDVPASLNKAVSCCTSALSISPTNTKALFRRAVAYEKLNDLDNALNDCKTGVELDKQNQDFKNIFDRVEKKIKLQLQKQKKKDYRYSKRMQRLTEKVKYALFFARTASLNSSRSFVSKVDSIDTTYQLGSYDSKELDACSDSTNLDQTYECSLSDEPYMSRDDDEDEYEDIGLFLDEQNGKDVSYILKSTKECKDEVISKLNFSYTNPAQVKSVYGLSPIDYRLNSLKDTLKQLNNIHTENVV